MDQADHPVRDRDRDARPNQRAPPRGKVEVFGAVEIDTRVPVVRPGGQRQVRIEANDRQAGRHGAKDYP